MTLSEIYLDYIEGTEASFNIIDQCIEYHESVMVKYLNNIDDSRIKVVEEAGTNEDLVYLEAEAKAEAVKKSQNIIIRLFKEFNNWVRTRFAKLQIWFRDKEVQRNLKTINSIVSKNPEIKNKKIEIHDVKGAIGCCNKYYDKSKVYDTELRSGIIRSADKIDELKINYDKEKEVYTKATAVITIAAALSLLTWVVSSKDTSINEEKADDYYKNISAFTNPEDMTKLSNAAAKVTNLRFTIQKDKGNHVMRSANEIISKIRSAVTGKNEVPLNFELPGKKINPLSEGTLDDEFKNQYITNIIDEIDFNESVNSITPEEYLDATVDSISNSRLFDEAYIEDLKEAQKEDHINEILDSLDIN